MPATDAERTSTDRIAYEAPDIVERLGIDAQLMAVSIGLTHP